ncbi:hypothetical protein HELRODRAFT_156415 [Helobdella robusta]|uniref:AAA+ ATPase domain-containing protein n=1 Tax=Helobdella robusta TaxID=6412 RepID=T1ELV8_HELRO|nr:hypothetical protein HELRODRAFT_156415 [Helobdella robusta]ESO09222.1 hypothetical protein HELRODRAFT_156415 [Helobdella robusta]
MRPENIENFVGQDHLLGSNKMLKRLLENNYLFSLIFWGPPGCGKTTLAKIISNNCTKESNTWRSVHLSATTTGIADVKNYIDIAKNEKRMTKRRTLIFVDEIHRFNKLQQDIFLQPVEDGTIILIGATTENPSFSINNALLSRCQVIQLEKLSVENFEKTCIVESNDNKNDAGLMMIAELCDGDARKALNILQSLIGLKQENSEANDMSTKSIKDPFVSTEDVKNVIYRIVQYDRNGDEHYNAASALQKSIRGSDENASIYWLARMLEGGEDPLFIARRLVVCASEDIGLADNCALPLAVSTLQACQLIGVPECSINLAHCVTYLARAAKSNESYMALKRAQQNILDHKGPLPGVPLHLRNAPTKLLKDLGYHKGYIYNHSHIGPVDQSYLPESLSGINFFQPS